MASTTHHIQGRARSLLEQAVKLQPDSQRGLWLLGISDFQDGRFADAAATWRILQPQLDPGSQVAQAVAQQIALADARAGAPAPASSSSATENTTPTTAKADGLTVRVALAPALKARVAAGDVLFVYARSENGPPMPLAVARLNAGALPATVTLTDALSMMPSMKLSSVSRVYIGARISKSGQAIAQPGDLEGNAGVVDAHRHAPITVTIDTIHP